MFNGETTLFVFIQFYCKILLSNLIILVQKWNGIVTCLNASYSYDSNSLKKISLKMKFECLFSNLLVNVLVFPIYHFCSHTKQLLFSKPNVLKFNYLLVYTFHKNILLVIHKPYSQMFFYYLFQKGYYLFRNGFLFPKRLLFYLVTCQTECRSIDFGKQRK